MTQKDLHEAEEVARSALLRYGLAHSEVHFVKHRENHVFRVDVDGSAYASVFTVPATGMQTRSLMNWPTGTRSTSAACGCRRWSARSTRVCSVE